MSLADGGGLTWFGKIIRLAVDFAIFRILRCVSRPRVLFPKVVDLGFALVRRRGCFVVLGHLRLKD